MMTLQPIKALAYCFIYTLHWSFSILPCLFLPSVQKNFHCSTHRGTDEPVPNLVPSLSAQREQTISATLVSDLSGSIDLDRVLASLSHQRGALYMEAFSVQLGLTHTTQSIETVFYLIWMFQMRADELLAVQFCFFLLSLYI